jgi:hypothetical protein
MMMMIDGLAGWMDGKGRDIPKRWDRLSVASCGPGGVGRNDGPGGVARWSVLLVALDFLGARGSSWLSWPNLRTGTL